MIAPVSNRLTIANFLSLFFVYGVMGFEWLFFSQWGLQLMLVSTILIASVWNMRNFVLEGCTFILINSIPDNDTFVKS